MGRRSAWAQFGGVIALCLSFIVARSLYSARSEWEAAQVALSDKQTELAMAHLRRAASWHVPLSPYTQRAEEALRDLEVLERAQGHAEGASMARRAREAAQHASRTLATRLRRDPNAGFALLALLGWLTWSAAAFRFVVAGLDAEGRPGSRAYAPAGAMLIGFVLFTLGLSLA